MNARLLKLRAQDAEDIEVISAVLQDSIVPVCDIAFQPETHSFVVVVQRLRREGGAPDERICSALTLKGVTAVHTHGIDPHEKESMLDLLAIILEPSKQLNLVFAADARIRLDLTEWAATLEDFGESWPTLCRPCHDDAVKGKP